MWIGIRRRNTPSCVRLGSVDPVPPGATTNDPQSACLRALCRSSTWPAWVEATAGIAACAGAAAITLGVRVLRPLPDISGHIEKTPRARCARGHRPRRLASTTTPCAHTHDRVRTGITGLIAPLVARVVGARRCALPLGLTWQSTSTPRTECSRFIPAHRDCRLRVSEVAAERHETPACALTNTRIPMGIRHLMRVDQEGRDTDRFRRARVRLIVVCASCERTAWDARHPFRERRRTRRVGGQRRRRLGGPSHA